MNCVGIFYYQIKFKVWRFGKRAIEKSATVTISVFNNAVSNAFIQIVIHTKASECVDFTVPPGNTLSATVEDAKSIMVYRLGEGSVNGKFVSMLVFQCFVSHNIHQNGNVEGARVRSAVGDRKSLFC